MSDITPPRKKGKFSAVVASPNVDARCWVTYNEKHDEINLFVRGLPMQASVDAFNPLQLSGVCMQSKSGAFMTVRSPAHAVMAIEAVAEKTGSKKLDVEKLRKEAGELFLKHNLWPVMQVTTDDETIFLSGRLLDHLGGFLSHHFQAVNTEEDKYQFPITNVEEHKEDLKELCDEWGWKMQEILI